MEVLALLPPPLLSHLRLVLGDTHLVTAVAHSGELAEAVARRPVELLVVDPTFRGPGAAGDGMDALVAMVGAHPTLPAVAYTSFTPTAMRSVVELSRRGVEHVVLFRFDDEPRRFRELLERLGANVLTETMLDMLEGGLARTSPALARAIERLFRQPQSFFTAQDLARAAGMTVRTVYRQCELAGLASPRLLVIGARLLRAYQFMRDPGHSIEDVALKLGYSAPRMFTRHARLALDATPRDVRRGLTPVEMLRRLERLLMPAAAERA